jgi:hypothetical protein
MKHLLAIARWFTAHLRALRKFEDEPEYFERVAFELGVWDGRRGDFTDEFIISLRTTRTPGAPATPSAGSMKAAIATRSPRTST